MSDFAARKTKVDDALDACGIGHNVGELFRNANRQIAQIMATALEAAHDQLAYDLLVNRPCGIEIAEDAGEHAARVGLITALGKLANWGINRSRQDAGEILENVNDHEEAARLFALAKDGA